VQENAIRIKFRVSPLIGADPLEIILILPPKAFLIFFKAIKSYFQLSIYPFFL